MCPPLPLPPPSSCFISPRALQNGNLWTGFRVRHSPWMEPLRVHQLLLPAWHLGGWGIGDGEIGRHPKTLNISLFAKSRLCWDLFVYSQVFLRFSCELVFLCFFHISPTCFLCPSLCHVQGFFQIYLISMHG